MKLENAGKRSVEEWIGNADTAIPNRVRVRVFDRYGGRCQCGCNNKIRISDAWDAEHAQAIINGGENRESNLRPYLREHHRGKTALDVQEKSRIYQKRVKILGLKKPKHRWGYGKNDKLKKKIRGEVVER